MAKRTDLTDPLKDFGDLRPYVRRLRLMQQQCSPMGGDYLAIAVALDSIETAAGHFTGQRHFYSAELSG